MRGAIDRRQPSCNTENNQPTLESEHPLSKQVGPEIPLTPQEQARASTNNNNTRDVLLPIPGNSIIHENTRMRIFLHGEITQENTNRPRMQKKLVRFPELECY